ncbi:MAG: hypothetical protein ACR2F0_03010, partial [Chthoniobacterales bacterium]
PNDIQHFARVTEREESFDRTGPESWKAASEGQLDQTNIQSLLNTLASLRAVRWVGANNAEQGFEKSPLAITFAVKSDPKTMHKLLIGGPAANEMWFARVDGREGTFVMSSPDLSALKLLLLKSAATPAPAAAVPDVSAVPGPPSSAETPTPR